MLQPAEFLRASRVVIVAGKGGVGKTAVTAALARLAADAGVTTLVIEVEPGAAGLSAAFGAPPLSYDEVVLSAGSPRTAEVRGRAVTAEAALLDYLDDHGLRRVSRRLLSSGAVDVVATAAPGIDDILVLGKVKQLERLASAGRSGPGGGAAPGLIVVDAPAAGHALGFLGAAAALADTMRSGPVRVQADEVLELLGDPARCSVMLVTLAEETPVNELIETAYRLEDRVGVQLGPVVVNGVYPALGGIEGAFPDVTATASHGLTPADAAALATAADFRRRRTRLQTGQVARLAERLPLPQLHLPFLFGVAPGPALVGELATHLQRAVVDLDGPGAGSP